MTTAKEKYRALCLTEKSIPLFSLDWWLDTVCGEDNWDVLLAEDKGVIKAAMPLYYRHARIVSMPPYTQTMGPWFASASDDTKYASALGDKQAISNLFVAQLNANRYFLQNFHYTVTDWLPFYWAGYKQSTRYTYLLPDIRRPEIRWEQMSTNIRRNITKAKEKHFITVKRGIPVDDFMAVYALTFERQQQKAPHTDTLKRLIAVCRDRDQGDLWGGYDDKGRLHAVAFIVWQERSAYYLAGGADPSLRDSGAHSAVMWEGIQAVSAYAPQFDFEGSMLRGVERFFREFGGIQTPFFTISKGKMSLIHKVWLKLFH